MYSVCVYMENVMNLLIVRKNDKIKICISETYGVCVFFLWCWQNPGALDIVCGNAKARVIANVLPLRPGPWKFYVENY